MKKHSANSGSTPVYKISPKSRLQKKNHFIGDPHLFRGIVKSKRFRVRSEARVVEAVLLNVKKAGLENQDQFTENAIHHRLDIYLHDAIRARNRASYRSNAPKSIMFASFLARERALLTDHIKKSNNDQSNQQGKLSEDEVSSQPKTEKAMAKESENGVLDGIEALLNRQSDTLTKIFQEKIEVASNEIRSEVKSVADGVDEIKSHLKIK